MERAAHWFTAALVGVLIATGAVLYVPAFARGLGGRSLVQPLHTWVGIVVFAPLLLAVAGRWGRGLRADLRRFNRFSADDKRWLSTFTTSFSVRLGKFNPGQKLNAVVVGASLTVLFLTGLVLKWARYFPDSIRTGATFVHDVFAVALTALIAAHVVMALTHPQALRSMVTGWIGESWAERHSPAWLEELGLRKQRRPAGGASGGGGAPLGENRHRRTSAVDAAEPAPSAGDPERPAVVSVATAWKPVGEPGQGATAGEGA